MLPFVLQSSYTTGQTALAIAVLVGLLMVALIGKLRLRYQGVPEHAREHIEAIVGHQTTTEPASARLPKTLVRDDIAAVRDRAEELVDRAMNDERGGSARPARIAILETWHDATDSIPARARQLGELTILVVVFGSIAVSADAIQEALAAQPQADPATILSFIEGNAASLLTTGQDVLSMFPFAGIVWALAFSAVILAIEWLYAHWWLVAAALAASAVGIWRLDDELDVGGGPYLPLRTRALGTLGSLTLVWLMGTVPAVAGRAVGFGNIGSIIGLLAALVVGGIITIRRTKRYANRLTRIPTDGGIPWAALGYRIARSVSGALIVVAVPMALLWAGAAVVSGNIVAVAKSVAAADPLIQLVVLLGVGGLVAGAGLLMRQAWPDVRESVLETATRARIRGAVWASGVPVFAGAMLYVGLTEMAPLPIAAAVAIVAVLAIRWVSGLLSTARYTVSLRESATPERGQDVFLEVWVTADGDGTTQYLGRVSGTDLAHTDREAFVDAVVAAAEDVASDGEADPVLESVYYDRLTNQGITNPEEVRASLREAVDKDVFYHLRDGDGDPRTVRREWFDSQLDEYPDETVSESLTYWSSQGNIRLTDDIVELRSDPRRVPEQQRSGPRAVTV